MRARAGAADKGWVVVKRSIAEMDDPLLNSVLEYWHGLRGTRAMPRRQEIDPVVLPRPSLPHLLLVQVECHCFRYSLAGTAIELQFGMSVAGRLLQELPFGTDEAATVAQHQETVETQRPTYCEHEFVNTRRQPLHCRRLLLPLSADGATVTDLFGVCVFLPKPPGEAAAAIGWQ
jgi:hypothetical protein